MKETIDLLGKIITNILTALYEPFGFSLLLSFLAMFFYLCLVNLALAIILFIVINREYMSDEQLAELAPWSEKLQSIKNRM